MNKEEFETYFLMKEVEHTIYNHKIRKETLLLFKSKAYFDLFKNIVLTFNELEILDDDIKDNIYKILSEVKDIKNLDYNPLEDVNEIIINLNAPINKERVLKYYQYQLYLRSNDKRVFKCSLESIYQLKESLFCSIRTDYIILYTHIILDDDSFMKEINDIDKDNYISSIFAILEESPFIFKDSLFHQRVCTVLDRIDNSKNKLDSRITKKLKKRINKARRK